MRAPALFATLVLAAAAAWAQPAITIEEPSCLPLEDNGIVRARATGEAPGGSARLYFRWEDQEDFYWVAFEPDGGGRYWTTPPKAERRNERVDYYGALVDAAGTVVAKSEPKSVKVDRDCRVRLSEEERGVAENLTVGETVAAQEGRKVIGFLCEGIVTRVDPRGIRRADEVCRTCVVAWWEKKSILIPAMAGAGVITGVIITDEDPDPSPSRP